MRILSLLILFGCARSERAEPKAVAPIVPVATTTTKATCEQVAEHSKALMLAEGGEKLRVRAQQIAEIVVRRCNADGWSSELRGCLGAAKTVEEADRCEEFATPAQEDAIEKEADALEHAD